MMLWRSRSRVRTSTKRPLLHLSGCHSQYRTRRSRACGHRFLPLHRRSLLCPCLRLVHLLCSSAAIEPMSAVARPSIPRVPSRANLLEAALPPIAGSASTLMTFRNPSQVSLAHSSSPAASLSKVSLLPSPTMSAFSSNRSSITQQNNGSTSCVSLLPPMSKRVSFQSNAGVAIEQPESIHPLDSSSRRKVPQRRVLPRAEQSQYLDSSKPKTPKVRASGVSVPVHHAAQTKRSALSSHSTADLNIGTMASGIPSSTSFTPPAKLASVLAGEMPTPPRQPNASKIGVSHMLVSPPPKSKLPMAPSRTVSSMPSKVPRSAATVGGIKVPVISHRWECKVRAYGTWCAYWELQVAYARLAEND